MATSTKPALSQLSEHILEANYRETTRDFCGLIGEGAAPLSLGLEGMRVASPYLAVPAHVMMKPNGDQRSVNFDHVVLGMWRSVRMRRFMPEGYADLPMAQAFWYLPQGLDIWSQILCEFPGHYAFEQEKCPEINLKGPVGHFEEYPPLREGAFEERLDTMLQSIVQGDKATAFRAFLGLAEEAAPDEAKRRVVEANVLFAGIIDLPGPRMLPPNLINGAHKAIRARAMVDLAEAVGWENAYPIFFAVIPDLATNPRYYDLYEAAATYLGRQFGRDFKDLRHTNTGVLNAREIEDFVDVMLHGGTEQTFLQVSALLAAGKSLVAINDAAILASARLMAGIEGISFRAGFSQAAHCFDYSNIVGYWLRRYDHEQQVKAAYFAPYFVNESVRTIRQAPRIPGEEFTSWPHEHAAFADKLPLDRVLVELSKACDEQRAPEATALVDSYLARSKDRKRLVGTLAFEAAKWEGDPHIQRNAMSHHEELTHSTLPATMRDEIFRSWTRFLSRAHKRSYEFNCFDIYKTVLRQ